jgi:hypothetical protein
MKKKLIVKLVLVLALIDLGLFVLYIPLRPWMDKWGAEAAEISASLPGDGLIANPALVTNRAVTIQATSEKIFPWLLQMGADKAGLYSYTWLEKMIAYPQTNADRIHPEWQGLKIGDPVRLCPEGSGPLPYQAAEIIPDQALIVGHQEADGRWVDSWAFVLQPAGDGTTRLIARSRTTLTGGIWDVIHPGVFIMERGMLLGIKEQAEKLAQQ